MFTKCHMLEMYSKQTWKKKNLNKRTVISKVLRAFPCEIQVHLWDYTSICISIVQGCSRKHNYKSKYFGKQ